MLTSMLKDRLIEFSESKKEEWGLIRSKIGDGVELPLPMIHFGPFPAPREHWARVIHNPLLSRGTHNPE